MHKNKCAVDVGVTSTGWAEQSAKGENKLVRELINDVTSLETKRDIQFTRVRELQQWHISTFDSREHPSNVRHGNE